MVSITRAQLPTLKNVGKNTVKEEGANIPVDILQRS